MIPPGENAAFVAAMEHVLSVYAEPYDAKRPVVCLDERPCALVGEGRELLPMRPGSDAKQDHEYVRGGLCCAFLAFEPLAGWRRAWVRPQRRRVEFAHVVRDLCDEVYPDAERVRLVCDNLNTHSAASFYAAFEPVEAKRISDKVEFVYTPVHGSWLNVVECELGVMVRQCLGHRRLGQIEVLRREIEAWVASRNAEGATVDWQMTTGDARTKLKWLYPTLSA